MINHAVIVESEIPIIILTQNIVIVPLVRLDSLVIVGLPALREEFVSKDHFRKCQIRFDWVRVYICAVGEGCHVVAELLCEVVHAGRRHVVLHQVLCEEVS